VVNAQPELSQVLVRDEEGVRTFYVYGLGLIGEESEGEYRAYHFDYRGSTVALTDEVGQVIERFQYGPYGELISGEAAATPFLFNGAYGVMTDGNGLYYMRARFYSPQVRRFVNRDILLGRVAEGQSLNRFGFVMGNPINFVDPFGLAKTCGQCAIGADDCLLYDYHLCEPGTASIAPDFSDPSLLPEKIDTFPQTPDISVCSYYDNMASTNGCNYHFNAASICRGERNPWSFTANFFLKSCSLFIDYPTEQVKNCVRNCLVHYDTAINSGSFPSCQINCIFGTCTHLNCIDAYHHTCFEHCGISWICYGGNYDFSSLFPNLFYDKCPTEMECMR